MGCLEGKTAVITGGTRGLGLAMALEFGKEGAAVMIASRSSAAIEKTVARLREKGIQANGAVCNVSQLSQVSALADRTVSEFGKFDIWVNNAALSGPYGPTIQISPDEIEHVWRTNIFGVYYGSWVALRFFLRQGSGKIINLLGRGDREPTPMQNAYASSKSWVLSFTQTLAKENKKSNVGIFAFNPGLMPTDLLRQVEAVQGYEGRLKPLTTVMQMFSRPPEVAAKKAAWLASAATDGKTGLVVNMIRPSGMVAGVLGYLARRVTGKPGLEFHLDVKTIPPEFPELM